MSLPKEFYYNITAEQLEEHIEDVNWEFVPKSLITSELMKKFPSMSGRILEGQLIGTLKAELLTEILKEKAEKVKADLKRNKLKNHFKHVAKKKKRK